VSTVPGKEVEVMKAISSIKGVSETHLLFGEYDLIAKVEVEDQEALTRMIIAELRKIDGVIDSKTLTGVKL